MEKVAIPFNIALLPVDERTLAKLKPVTTADIFDGMSKNFHNDGLYSTVIFGKVGDEMRKRLFAFIDIKLSVFHPIIYKSLVSLKKMYGEILNGKLFAVWDDEIKDFVKSTPMDGETGFEFFMRHWTEIEFQRRPSDIREENIKLVEKYRKELSASTPSKVVVLPAGLRDFEVQGDGRYSEEEVNALYKKLLSLAAHIPKSFDPEDLSIYNGTRMALQRTFNDIYELYESMVKGKKKLMLGKWASRKIFNSTRNVLTSMSASTNKLGNPGNLDFNSTIIGLYQFIKATLPITIYKLKNGFLSQVFTGPNSPALLVDKNTLHKVALDVKPEIFDAWMTDEGLEKIITRFGEASLRHQVLEISGHYLGLVYKDKNYFKFFQDIDDLPEGLDPANVKPITFIELIYVSVYEKANTYPMFVTRYPIASQHSIYTSRVFLKSTTLSQELTPLDDNWEPMPEKVAYQYPIIGVPDVEAMSPHVSKLQSLGADENRY